MSFVTADRIVFLWAHRNSYGCETCRTDGAVAPCMRVQLNHAAAFIRDGQLVRLDTRCDGRFTDELAAELANLFALCGYLELRRTDAGVDQDAHPERANAAPAESVPGTPQAMRDHNRDRASSGCDFKSDRSCCPSAWPTLDRWAHRLRNFRLPRGQRN